MRRFLCELALCLGGLLIAACLVIGIDAYARLLP